MRMTTTGLPLHILSIGIVIGLAAAPAAQQVWAALSGPSEHQGLSVNLLAELPADTLQATIGLEGYTLRMRSVEIAPGGQIAEHSHKDRPGIVTMVEGEWVEGQSTGENTFAAQGYGTFSENEDTVHWVYNRTDAPSVALVCDIAKAE